MTGQRFNRLRAFLDHGLSQPLRLVIRDREGEGASRAAYGSNCDAVVDGYVVIPVGITVDGRVPSKRLQYLPQRPHVATWRIAVHRKYARLIVLMLCRKAEAALPRH